MSVFPFITPLEDDNTYTNNTLEVFKEYAFDFENNCLKLKNNMTYFVEKNEALKIWIYKTLKTDRFKHLAYTHAYGSELNTLIGMNIHGNITYSEIRRFIIEALMVNPYIKELSNFEFEQTGSYIKVSFFVSTIYGNMIYLMDWGDI